MLTRTHMLRFVDRARHLPALSAAFVFPCDRDSLQLALASAFTGTLAPVLVGPETRIRDAAGKAGIDLARLPIVDTADTPRAAAIRAVELARSGSVAALVKGSLGNEDLLAPVSAPESGLRGPHRLSHAYFLDLAGWPNGMLLADAQLNINPSLAAKRDIVQNTIGFAHALGIAAPRVALLAAMATVNPAFQSTLDATALKSMADGGMFADAAVDGPLAADSALSADAADANGHRSEVAGRADVLIAPGMESALLVLRTLTALTSGLAAGLVLGARVPIVAPARTDTMEVRMASCVLASLMAAAIAGAAGRPASPAARHAPVESTVE
jgi:phosphate acetyltransferase